MNNPPKSESKIKMTNDQKFQAIIDFLKNDPSKISRIFKELKLVPDYRIQKYYEEGFLDGSEIGRSYHNPYKSDSDECLNYEDGYADGVEIYREKYEK